MGRGSESGRAALALLLLLPTAARTAELRRYDFTAGGNAHGRPAYDVDRGFGFEPGPAAQFSVRAPEGNVRVSLHFARTGAPEVITVRAEQRRLMVEGIEVGRRDDQVIRFAVNLRTPALPARPENAGGDIEVMLRPREIGSRTWDDRLTLEFDPWPASLEYLVVQPVSLPTLHLAGDSTVTDQGMAPNASWGQLITRYFKDDIAIANHAESGESLKSFVTEMRLDKLLSTLQPGDWVMIQFGHNDQKAQWPLTHVEAATTYRDWLRTYIGEIRRRGATPLLVTSPERRHFDPAGRIRPTLAEYAQAMRAVAGDQKVALLDLHAASIRVYEALGPALAPRAFADGGTDQTHHNEYGARLLARCVAEALRSSDPALTAGLASHLAADTGRFDPASPPLPEERTMRREVPK